MDWKLFDEDNVFLQEVNCQYDSLDLASMEHDAERVEVDFKNKIARIIKRVEE